MLKCDILRFLTVTGHVKIAKDFAYSIMLYFENCFNSWSVKVEL